MTSNFIILHQAAKASPQDVTQLRLNDPRYNYVASAANIGMSILEQPEGRAALTLLALRIDRFYSREFHNDQGLARQRVDLFLAKLRTSFPMIIINDNITTLGMLGYHPSGHLNGRLADFSLREQSINLNGSRVRDMIASVDQSTARFRSFQFMFAVTFIREIGGHLLYTFLSHGRTRTAPPRPEMSYTTEDDELGECGRYLESTLFGGTMIFYQDPSQDESQPGVPYLDAHGKYGIWKVDSACIAGTIESHFTLPLAMAGHPSDPQGLRPMGEMSNGPPTKASQQEMMAQQTGLNTRTLPNSGFTVRISDLWTVAKNPRSRLREY